MTKAALLAARGAFHKLSCLGNGDRFGNSEGNVIAQQALALIDAALAQPEWTLPHAVYTAFDDTTKLYTADQMRAAFEAGRISK